MLYYIVIGAFVLFIVGFIISVGLRNYYNGELEDAKKEQAIYDKLKKQREHISDMVEELLLKQTKDLIKK